MRILVKTRNKNRKLCCTLALLSPLYKYFLFLLIAFTIHGVFCSSSSEIFWERFNAKVLFLRLLLLSIVHLFQFCLFKTFKITFFCCKSECSWSHITVKREFSPCSVGKMIFWFLQRLIGFLSSSFLLFSTFDSTNSIIQFIWFYVFCNHVW